MFSHNMLCCPAKCEPLSYDTCAQFAVEFDKLYDGRNTDKYPLRNPMLKLDQVLVNYELVNDGSSICGAGKEVTQDECVSAAKQIGGVNGDKLAELTGTSNNKWNEAYTTTPRPGEWTFAPCGCFLWQDKALEAIVDIDYNLSANCNNVQSRKQNLGVVCKVRQ